jgi:hypothetical protein
MKEVRAFPVSRNRSARMRKKLIKRFGFEVRMEPCAIKMGDHMVVHPEIYSQLQRQTQERVDRQMMEMITGRLSFPLPSINPPIFDNHQTPS